MMASTMSIDWPQSPATPPSGRDDDGRDDDGYPPPFQWWPSTPGPSRGGADGDESFLMPPSIASPPFSPFSAFANQPAMFAPSPFLQPFMGPSKNQQLQPPTSGQQSMSPFGTGTTSPFASMRLPHQPPPQLPASPAMMISPPPSNAHSSPSPFGSARGSPQNDARFLQPRGVLKRHSFLKLPPEVRASIYQELVPDKTELHVTMEANPNPMMMGAGAGKMFSYPCLVMNDAEYVGRHWFSMTEPEYRKLGSTPRECGHLACVKVGPRMRGLGRDERGWVGLLMSCKAIHDEFAPYLYARPRLMFDNVVTLRRFLETADSSRLRHYVRNLSIAYLVPECPTVGSDSSHYHHRRRKTPRLDDWTRSWQGIALMEGLKHLHVTLVARGAFANRDYEAHVLRPLLLLLGKRKKDGQGGRLEDFDVVSFEGTRACGLPSGFEEVPFRYMWRAWGLLGGPELERVARRHKQFVDAQPPYWHHLSSYHQHAFYRGDFNMRSLYSVM